MLSILYISVNILFYLWAKNTHSYYLNTYHLCSKKNCENLFISDSFLALQDLQCVESCLGSLKGFWSQVFLLVVEYHKTFVGVFVSSYTLSESKYDLHCVWPQGPAMANLTIFPLSYFVSKRYFQQCRKQNQILKSPTYVLTVFSKSYQFPYFKTFKVSMILVHKSANFTVHIFFYCFTGFTPLVGFLDVICSSVGFAYHVNGSWF